jgi:nucleotidyltransferase/DNA polymerase involved in DNA repair
MRRYVGYIHIEGFYAAHERGGGREGPFAVMEGDAIRDADAIARKAGAVPGVSLRVARRLCADLAVVPYDPRRYAGAARRWMRLGLRHVPWLEPLEPHAAFLDLTGHPNPEEAIHALHEEISEDGLQVRAALAGNKFLARAITMVPNPLGGPVAVVPRGAESAFLAPHPVSILWPLDPKTLARLERLEYGSVAEVAAAATADLKSQIGKAAPLVHALSRGIYPDPVRPLFPEATIRFHRRFEPGLETMRDISHFTEALAAGAARRLGGRCCRVLSVTLELEGGLRLEARETRRLLDGKGLVAAAARLVERMAPREPVTGLAVIAASLTDPPPVEGDLFSLDKMRRRRALAETVTCLEERYGKRAVFPLASVPVPWRERQWAAFWSRHRGGRS